MRHTHASPSHAIILLLLEFRSTGELALAEALALRALAIAKASLPAEVQL